MKRRISALLTAVLSCAKEQALSDEDGYFTWTPMGRGGMPMGFPMIG